ncbi:MAG: molybdopterin-dependent oxidoreductase, partial [Alphaproteobacteria bacterium]|nr:molybdopterin-dependent oxidoreductase [Alphaproteobacteria bacterium]
QADACLIVGSNPRREAALINARLRKRYLTGGLKIGVIGPRANLAYEREHLGEGADVLAQVASGAHPFMATLKAAKNPMLIIGMGALARPDGAAVLALARQIAEAAGMVRDDWNGFNVLHTAAGRVGALELGFLPGPGGRDVAGVMTGAERGEIDVVYLLAADELDTGKLGRAFVIYQGHHGDRGAHRADVILPGAAYTEKHGTYVNTEGRVQRGFPATFPPGEAREDWKILRALAQHLGIALPYDTIGQLRARLAAVAPTFAKLDVAQPGAWGAFGEPGPTNPAPFASPIDNFYMTDPISRASETMAQCTDLFIHGREPEDKQELTGTYG